MQNQTHGAKIKLSPGLRTSIENHLLAFPLPEAPASQIQQNTPHSKILNLMVLQRPSCHKRSPSRDPRIKLGISLGAVTQPTTVWWLQMGQPK